MRRRVLLLLAAIAGAMACSGFVSLVVVPRNWEANNVPERWREGRWEMGPDGLRARALTESRCGEIPQDAWLDLPADSPTPVIHQASEELTRCFEGQVVPQLMGPERIRLAPSPRTAQ